MNRQSAIAFASWLRVAHPRLYAQAAKRADVSLAVREENERYNNNNNLGLIDIQPAATQKTGWLDTFMKTAAGLGTTYLSLKNQRDQMQINIERAQMGLQPIDIGGTPIITTEVKLPPETVDKITASAGLQINKILLFGGAAVALFFFMR